jgi:hypothetical protein
MKKLLVILFSVGLALGASAQRGGGHYYHGGGGGYVYRPHVSVGFGLGYGFGYPFGYPYYGFGYPFGYPYPPYYYGQGPMPSRLGLQIEDIKNDYKAQIKDTRADKSVPRKERKEKIRQLKHDRDQAIIKARKDYYYNSRKNYNNNNNQPRNNNSPNSPNKNNQQSTPQKDNSQQPEYNDNSGSGN